MASFSALASLSTLASFPALPMASFSALASLSTLALPDLASALLAPPCWPSSVDDALWTFAIGFFGVLFVLGLTDDFLRALADFEPDLPDLSDFEPDLPDLPRSGGLSVVAGGGPSVAAVVAGGGPSVAGGGASVVAGGASVVSAAVVAATVVVAAVVEGVLNAGQKTSDAGETSSMVVQPMLSPPVIGTTSHALS